MKESKFASKYGGPEVFRGSGSKASKQRRKRLTRQLQGGPKKRKN